MQGAIYGPTFANDRTDRNARSTRVDSKFDFTTGDNLENLLGHIRYAFFYIVCGFAAASAQIVMGPDSIIPMLGASGAISGVLGGYVLLFPKRQVRAIIFNFLTTVPAFVAIGIWIAYQLIVGYLTPAGTGGVAYAAHIGGFIAGIALIKLFEDRRRVAARTRRDVIAGTPWNEAARG